MSAIAHAFTEQNTPQSTSSITYVDVSGASIASSNFVAGQKYLIYITAQVGTQSGGDDTAVDVQHGTTTFADSESFWDTNTPGPILYYTYTWLDVWTAVAGEGIKLRFKAGIGTQTVNMDQISMLAIRLDADLAENIDWFYSNDTADLSLTTTWQTGASVTFSPGTAGHDWLVLTDARIDSTSATVGMQTRIDRSGEAASTLPQAIQASGASTTGTLMSLARVFTLGAASNTLREQASCESGTVHTRLNSKIFALNMDKFRNHSFAYTEADANLSATDWATQLQTVSLTPDIAGDAWIGSYWGFDKGAAARNAEFRIQIDNSDQPAGQTTDDYLFSSAFLASDEYPLILGTMPNLTAAAHTVDLDASADATTGVPAAQQVTLWAVTMELPAAVAAPSLNVVRSNLRLT